MKGFKKFCNETLIPVLFIIAFVVECILRLPFEIIKDILLAVWFNLHSSATIIFDIPDMMKEFKEIMKD